MNIQIPALCLVVLIGASGSGKSTFARRHFKETEILSSDAFRAMLADDEGDLSATSDAFAVLHDVLSRRLAAGRLTVVDATNLRREDRGQLIRIAKQHHVLHVAIVLNLPLQVCVARNDARGNRQDSRRYVSKHLQSLRESLRNRGLEREGFRHVTVLSSPEEIDAVTITRTKLWNDHREDHGPFDLIGDVHGCRSELETLLGRLGYEPQDDAWRHPAGRRALFLGDLVDRGPDSPGALRIAMDMVAAGTALAIPGNHEIKLQRALTGGQVKLSHGLAETLAQIDALPDPQAFRDRAISFIDKLISHLVLDGGRLVVAHAGLKEAMHGRASAAVRSFALFGDTTGETDEYGLPVRYPWANEYRGKAAVVYGHTPTPTAEWLNHTVCIDTGCVFGGQLTALRWPERELISVPAERVWYEPVRPLLPPEPEPAARSAQQLADDELDLGDVTGKRVLSTRLQPSVLLQADRSAAALETMSRFAVDPRWLIYLPPTMSPCPTSKREGWLEHPDEAFAEWRALGVPSVVCEEKHMGSRAVLVVARSAEAAARRFGVTDGSDGVITTRTGRPFFGDPAMTRALLDRVRAAATAAGLWDELDADWLLLDAELMPWSAKGLELLRRQYAPVGRAARDTLGAATALLDAAVARGVPVGDLRERTSQRHDLAQDMVDAYRRYCWTVDRPEDWRLAPFHLLAAGANSFFDRGHAWHLDLCARLAAADGEVIIPTPHRFVDLADDAQVADAVAWWEARTAAGVEGMVIKPAGFLTRDHKGRWTQPAIKVRGRSYLRIIYGPEYTLPEHLERLKQRSLNNKRALAWRETALGVEAVERFVRHEPLRRVHECVFGVLALESERVDPRL